MTTPRRRLRAPRGVSIMELDMRTNAGLRRLDDEMKCYCLELT